MDPPLPHGSELRSQDDVERLMEVWLARPAAERDAAIDELCREHPSHADELRRRVEALRRIGVEVGSAGLDRAAPDRLGDFTLLRRLGEGGMGVVYAARQESLGREVALKIIRPEQLFFDASRERFRREAQVLAKLRHPNVVAVLAAGEERGVAYIAMELVPGKGLDEVLADASAKGEPPPVRWVLERLAEVARALEAAHAAGVIHRDVKPSNIRIGDDGRARLLDFGLARSAGASLSSAGGFRGTPHYAAPEQVEPDRGEVGPATDVYGLGVTLYECVTGRAAFSGKTSEQVLHQVLVQDPPAPRRVVPSISRDVEAVIQKAIEKEPARRYSSAAALAADLEAILELRPISARPISAAARLARWSRRNPAKASAAVMAVLLVVVAPSVIAWRESRSARAIADEQARTRAKLVEVRRLSDVQLVRQLIDRARRRPPAIPDSLPELEEWIASARDLLARRELHESTRARWEALPPGSPDAPSAWELEVLGDLVKQIETLAAQLAGMETHRAFAANVEERTVSSPEARAAWTKAIDAIASDPRYGGLRLAPQVGLVPLEPDPKSGLWEFHHVQSGERPARDPDTGRWRIAPETGVVLVLVPGGTYSIGCFPPSKEHPAGSPYVDPDAESNDDPVVEVSLDAYFLSTYEMTQGQWARASGANQSSYRPGTRTVAETITEAHPGESASWQESARVLRIFDLVLPSEAQWEVACRAGTTTVFPTGDSPASLQGYANIADERYRSSGGRPKGQRFTAEIDDGFMLHAPVGTFLPNAWGFHDMVGNVMEWCADSASAKVRPQSKRRAGDALVEGETEWRIARGGSYRGDASFNRVAFRQPRQTLGANEMGARPARDVRR